MPEQVDRLADILMDEGELSPIELSQDNILIDAGIE